MLPVQKISLRRIEKDDVGLLWKWSLNEELAFFNAFTSNKSRVEFEREYDARVGDPSLMDYLIIYGESETPIGFCGIKDINWVDRHGEIFISICDEKARKNGAATIAILILTKIAFYDINLNKVLAKVASHNTKIMNMMIDWGFTHEGTLREMHYRNNRYYDIMVYGVLKREVIDLMGTAVEKVTKHLFPGCSDETVEQIKKSIDTIMGSESGPGENLNSAFVTIQ